LANLHNANIVEISSIFFEFTHVVDWVESLPTE